jgi:hypothetical protein
VEPIVCYTNMVFSQKIRLPAAIALFIVLSALAAVASQSSIEYTPYSDAKPIMGNLADVLPPDLRGPAPDALEKSWPRWVKQRDTEIRERLARGDEDSLVNLLLFGTSFTSAARVTSSELNSLGTTTGTNAEQEATSKFGPIIQKRVNDFIDGMMLPGKGERLVFARKVIERAGINFDSEAGRIQAQKYLYANALRVLREQSGFQQSLAAAKSLNDPTEEFAERSKLYKERGLSLDTSLPPNYAIEVALANMRDRGLLVRGSIRRVGVIGPGLDFTDKQEGYDFYPVQTVQPFAVMDSLLRLGLSKPAELEMDTLDLSPRVNAHVARIRRAALGGEGYALQLPRDPSRGWKPELVEYWRRFGDQIAQPIKPVALPEGLKSLQLRAARVRPEFARRVRPLDVDIVLQREVGDGPKFDLLIATNILVYYDTFEQSLALANIAAMLKPGSYLLTNNLLLELPVSKMKGSDYASVEYSGREADGDRILWYARQP